MEPLIHLVRGSIPDFGPNRSPLRNHIGNTDAIFEGIYRTCNFWRQGGTEKIRNRYTIVPAPLRIELNTITYQSANKDMGTRQCCLECCMAGSE